MNTLRTPRLKASLVSERITISIGVTGGLLGAIGGTGELGTKPAHCVMVIHPNKAWSWMPAFPSVETTSSLGDLTTRELQNRLEKAGLHELLEEFEPLADQWVDDACGAIFEGNLSEEDNGAAFLQQHARAGLIADEFPTDGAVEAMAMAVLAQSAHLFGTEKNGRAPARELCEQIAADAGIDEQHIDAAKQRVASIAVRLSSVIYSDPIRLDRRKLPTLASAAEFIADAIEIDASAPKELRKTFASAVRTATAFALFFEGARELDDGSSEPGLRRWEVQPYWLRLFAAFALQAVQAEQAAWEAARARFASRKVEAVTQRGVTDLILRPEQQLQRVKEHSTTEAATIEVVSRILERVDHNVKYYAQRALRVIIAKATQADGTLEQNVHWPNWTAFVQAVAGHNKHADKVSAAVALLSAHYLQNYGRPGQSYESVIMLSGGGHGDQFTVTLSPFVTEPHRYPNARHNDRFLVPLTDAERTPRPLSPRSLARYVLGYQQALLYFSEHSLEYIERGSLPAKQLLDAVRDAAEFTKRNGDKQLDTWFEIATQGDNRPPQQRLQDPAPGVIFGGRFIELTDDGEIRLADSNPDYVRMIEDQGRQRLGGRRRQAASKKKKRKG